jgi:diketogulonate reductase-like aldo/keto reductase
MPRWARAAANQPKGATVTSDSPLITLNNGVEVPALGLGVFLTPPEQTAAAVEAAIASGYRLVDTAAAYGNERQVGEAIARSGLPRSELFVTTKLWVTDYGYEEALRAFGTSLRKLRSDYLDLYLLHWPVPSQFEATIAAYRAAEKLLAEGAVRAIGVSNFTPAHLKRLLERTQVVPAVNQVELHPFLIQRELQEANARLGILTQAWSPIGGVYGRNPSAAPAAAASPLAHPVITRLAGEHQKTAAEIVLRWHFDEGRSAIPKSVRPERIAENIDIFDFALSDDELAAIDSLDTGARAGSDPELVDARSFNIEIDAA